MYCINLSTCPFYNDKMQMGSELGTLYKKKYCMRNNEECARFLVFQTLGPELVPTGLYPGMLDVAHQIIESMRNSSALTGKRLTSFLFRQNSNNY